MKAKLKDLDVEAYLVSEETLPEVLNALQTYPAMHWSINWAYKVGIILQVEDAGRRHTASDGDWLVRVDDEYRVIKDELFRELFGFEVEVPLPATVWIPLDGKMVQTTLLKLPLITGKNQVMGSDVVAKEPPHGVKGFPLSFYPVEDAHREARLIAPRVAFLLGHDNLLGLFRLASGSDELEPGKLARFWFTVCNEHGQSIKEDK